MDLGRSREGHGARQFRPWLARFLGVCLVTAAAGGHAVLASAAVASGPPAPTGLTASAVSSTAVTLSWSPVSNGGVAVWGYDVYYVTGESSTVLISSVSAPATSYTVSGLTPSTTYQFAVAAYDDSGTGAAAALTVTTLPVQQSQTISFPRPPDAAAGQRVTLTASASSGLAVAFSSGRGGVCTVSGAAVTTVAPGTCTITAAQGGNADYAPAPSVTRSFHVSPVSVKRRAQTITFPRPPDAAAGRRVTLTASASSGLAVAFGSGSGGVCTVSGAAVSAVAPGTCTITASQGGNADYAPAPSVTQSFQVSPVHISPNHVRHRAQAIEFAQPRDTHAGRLVTLTASASSGLPVTFSSASGGVCTVSGAAVSAVAPGTCTITASQVGNAQYAAARPVTRSFRVDASAPIRPVRPNAPGPPALVIALAAAIAAAAGLAGAVLVRLRLRSRPPRQPSIRAEPHAGPPTLVGVHATGTERTQTVRIEPSPGTSSVTTRKASP